MENGNLRSQCVAVGGPLTFNFVPFSGSFGICAWVSAHYKAASSLLSQWLLNRGVRHVDKSLWGDSIDLIAFNIWRDKLE